MRSSRTTGLTRESNTWFLWAARADNVRHLHVLFKKKNAKTRKSIFVLLKKKERKNIGLDEE
jgi:hypothetical protein